MAFSLNKRKLRLYAALVRLTNGPTPTVEMKEIISSCFSTSIVKYGDNCGRLSILPLEMQR